MTTAQRVAEAERAAVVYHVAMLKIGAAMVAEALLLWQREMPPTGGVHAAGSWLAKVTRLILTKRREARALSRAYYQLDRALRLGVTIADASEPDESTTLNNLRSEFRRRTGSGVPTLGTEDAIIPIERIAGLDADALRQDREAEQEIRIALGNLGPVNLEKKLGDIDTNLAGKEVDAARQKSHDDAGARQAAAAERIALNGGRGDMWNAMQKDRRALGYIRFSTTGTPCGWCAMLISRGPVYKSKSSAETSIYGDGDLYHDNCNCEALPIYSLTDYHTSPLYAMNRQYSQEWPKVTKGLSGKAAISAWRRYIRTQQRSQAGRETTQAQEA